MGQYITWKPFYTVNDPALDAQHRQIIEILNTLYLALNAADTVAVTRRAMDQLVRYTHTHFADEERVMKEIGFPDLTAHKALHDQMR
jgi:hemerythrin-like metal-binding protein